MSHGMPVFGVAVVLGFLGKPVWSGRNGPDNMCWRPFSRFEPSIWRKIEPIMHCAVSPFRGGREAERHCDV